MAKTISHSFVALTREIFILVLIYFIRYLVFQSSLLHCSFTENVFLVKIHKNINQRKHYTITFCQKSLNLNLEFRIFLNVHFCSSKFEYVASKMVHVVYTLYVRCARLLKFNVITILFLPRLNPIICQ